MFTGLVREVGTVRSMDRGRLVIEATIAAELGDSVAVDGVCLTVVANESGTLANLTARPVGEDVLLEAYVHLP